MRENKTSLIIFVMLFVSLIVFLMSTEDDVVNDLSVTELKYTESEYSIDIGHLFNKERVVDYASNLFSEQTILKEDLDEDYILTSAVEKDFDAYELYQAYRDFSELIDHHLELKTRSIDLQTLVSLIPNDFYMEMDDRWIKVLESVEYIGAYDSYYIDDFNSYDYQFTAKVFTNHNKDYRVIYSDSGNGIVLHIDEAADMTINYAYHFKNDEFIKRTKIELDNIDQHSYNGFGIMVMERANTYSTSYREKDLLILKVEK
jgi:hypothetical protein